MALLYEFLQEAGEVFDQVGWTVKPYPCRPVGELSYEAAISRAMKAVEDLLSGGNSKAGPVRPGKQPRNDWALTLGAIHSRGWLLIVSRLTCPAESGIKRIVPMGAPRTGVDLPRSEPGERSPRLQ